MGVDGREIEAARDQVENGAHGFESSISTGLGLGRLKEAIDGFQETVGPAQLRPVFGNN